MTLLRQSISSSQTAGMSPRYVCQHVHRWVLGLNHIQSAKQAPVAAWHPHTGDELCYTKGLQNTLIPEAIFSKPLTNRLILSWPSL